MTKPQGKTLKPVVRDAAGRIVSGTANPGGMTKELREARDEAQRFLASPKTFKAGTGSYFRLLAEGDPIITKDFMDRVAGKPKDTIEHQGEIGHPFSALADAAVKFLADAKEKAEAETQPKPEGSSE
jgi:hypothetical protein